jgi:hypothetical protein
MFPKLTNINDKIVQSIKSETPIEASKLNCFVRVISGAGTGLIMTSNPDWKLFSAAGVSEPSFYGDSNGSGVVGMDWLGKPVYAKRGEGDIAFRPSPIVTAINVKEGKDQISRHCDLKITAYTLNQVEILQSYLMEPGYSLFIEYGWNTDLGVKGLIPINFRTIVSDAGKFSLDQDSLHLKRVDSRGEYDSFLGFIVGGTVSSNGDSFDISIKLRGAPGLPTYIQSHNNIEVIENGKVSNKYSRPPFGITDLNLPAQNQMAERRFKQMFNDLPKVRQTTFVTDLTKTEVAGGFSALDFINFDPVIEVQISNFRDGRDVSGVALPEDNKIIPNNANASQKEVAEGTGGDAAERIKVIADAILKNQTQFEESAMPPTLAQIAANRSFWNIDTFWEDFLEDMEEGDITLGNGTVSKTRVTGAEIGAAVATLDKKVKVVDGRNKYSYTKKAAPAPAPPPKEEPKPSSEQTGGGGTAKIESVAPTEIMLAGGLPLPKEKLFSKNKYIRFKKAVDILNANSAIQSFVVGGRAINSVLDIKDTPIGAFKGIYSCKPETLLIPGLIPDFSKFFMEQNLANLNDGEKLVDRSIGTLSFAQSTALNSGGFSEKAYYWGKLENLYINFELLKRELDTPNKTIREVLETLLNEMSSAVDAFWNFQVVEKTQKIKDKSGVEKDTLVYTVVDENWIGGNPNPAPVTFIHSGAESRFLDADLNIDIPGSMASQIVSKRLALSVNPSQPNLELGGIFTSQFDRFMTGYIEAVGSGTKGNANGTSGASGVSGTSGTSAQSEADKKLDERLNKVSNDTLTDEQKKAKEQLKADQKANGDTATKILELQTALRDLQSNKQKTKDDLLREKDKYDGDTGIFDVQSAGEAYNATELARVNRDLAAVDANIAAKEKEIKDLQAGVKTEEERINKALEDFEKAANEQIVANVSSNLDKIDVVPNPEENEITQDNLNNFLNSPDIFKQKFRIYCCKDAKYLNILKANAMGVSSGGGGRLSHPLPIKYSFTILGKSGIRRGDTFNINGIPKKYQEHGLFQVTQIEHTIQNMKWTTKVQGEYRQQQ